ncbi:MAG: hypothetical protein R3F56_14110 [Planctomycetota bacterium]
MRSIHALWAPALVGCAGLPVSPPLAVLPLASPTRASLRGVCAVTDRIVWVTGSDGTCLRSLDGGTTWIACGPGLAAGRDLRDVHAFGALHAVVMAVGSPALLLETDDGGATWREVWRDENPDAFLDGIAFDANGTGFAFGDPIGGRFTALRSRDAGATWEPIGTLPRPQPGEAAFAASGTCVAMLDDGTFLVATGGGEVARVLRGEDGGDRWRSSSTLVRAGTASRGIFSLAVHGERVVAVGGDYLQPDATFAVAAVSDDGARTWRRPAGASPGGYRSAAAFVPGRDGLVLVTVGPNGTDVSFDGGDNFEAADSRGFHAVAFAGEGVGFAVGADGRMARLVFDGADRTRL